MEEYIVSARKYRPATFDTVVGQRALTTTLLNAIRTGKLAHAYLFCGPRGVGKTTCARIFAKTINCLSPREDGEACNECESCRSFDRQTSMNIHELDAASNNGVDDMRDLTEQVRIPPQGGRYKVFIIDEVHMLSQAAFNAFLKTLEEPPSYVIFILATTEKQKIPPTVLSRCQVYDFQRMSIQNTVDHLAYVARKEGCAAEPLALNLIAQKADGGMRDALSIFDQMVSFTGGNITYQSALDNLNVLDSEYYFRLIDHFLAGEAVPCLLLFNEVLNRGFDGGNFVAGLASHARDLLVSRDECALPLLEVSEQARGRYQEQAARCDPNFLYRVLRLCNDCDVGYRQSANKRLQVELCLMRAAQLVRDDTPPGDGAAIKPVLQQPSAPRRQEQAAVATPSPKETVAKPASKETVAKPASEAAVAVKPKSQPLSRGMVSLNSVCINQTAMPREDGPADMAAEQGALYVSDRGRLTEGNLRQCWQHFASAIEDGDKANANRMRGIAPVVTSASSFTVTVGNDILEKELGDRKSAIEAFVSRHTGVPGVEMLIEVNKAQASPQVYDKTLTLRHMMKRSSALGKLVGGLELDID